MTTLNDDDDKKINYCRNTCHQRTIRHQTEMNLQLQNICPRDANTPLNEKNEMILKR